MWATWIMRIFMTSMCRLYRVYLHRKSKKLRVGLGFFCINKSCAFLFLKNSNCKQAFCYHSPFHLYQNSASQTVQKTSPSLKSGFSTCFFKRGLFSWDHFATSTELHLNQQTIHWVDSVWILVSSSHTQLSIEMLVIIKGHGWLLAVSWKTSKIYTVTEFYIPLKWEVCTVQWDDLLLLSAQYTHTWTFSQNTAEIVRKTESYSL